MRLLKPERILGMLILGGVFTFLWLHYRSVGVIGPQSSQISEVTRATQSYYAAHRHWPREMSDLPEGGKVAVKDKNGIHWTYRDVGEGRLEIHFVADGPGGCDLTKVITAAK